MHSQRTCEPPAPPAPRRGWRYLGWAAAGSWGVSLTHVVHTLKDEVCSSLRYGHLEMIRARQQFVMSK